MRRAAAGHGTATQRDAIQALPRTPTVELTFTLAAAVHAGTSSASIMPLPVPTVVQASIDSAEPAKRAEARSLSPCWLPHSPSDNSCVR